MASKNEDPRNGNHTTLWFILGAAAGIAAGYYLNSDNGRKMRREAGDQIAGYGTAISERASGGARQVRSYANDIGEAIRKRLDALSDKTETLRHRLDEQIDSGKNVLKGKARKLENEVEKRLN